MRKTIAVLLCLTCLFSMSGCNILLVDDELTIYSNTVNELLTALDNKDADAIYNLFSISVQNERPDLKEKVQELVSVYTGSTDEVGDFSTLSGEGSYVLGNKVQHNANTTFPVFSDGIYYWIYLDLMYTDITDEDQVGITQLDFYTADAYYEFWSGDKPWKESKGLNIFNKTVESYNIISINNYPYDYHPTEAVNLEEVKEFLETSTSAKAFKDKFGAAASSDDFGTIYPLPEQDGEDRYLYLSFEDDTIIHSEVLGKYAYIDSVLEEHPTDI